MIVVNVTALWEYTMVKILISVMILDANLDSHNKVRLIAESRSLASRGIARLRVTLAVVILHWLAPPTPRAQRALCMLVT